MMSPPPGSSPAPHRPARPNESGSSGQPRPPHRRLPPVWPFVLGGLVAALVLSCVVAFWLAGGPVSNFTYTPAQGPPNRALLDSRPEAIAERYLADYISLAGTYPCLQDLNQFGTDTDPVLQREPCHVTRPVASYTVTSVTIHAGGLYYHGYPEGIVSFVVNYTSGQQWAYDLYLGADLHVGYVLSDFHLDCWSSSDTLELFERLVPADIPPGASYGPPGGPYLCKNHAGHMIDLGDRNGHAALVRRSRQDAVFARARGCCD